MAQFEPSGGHFVAGRFTYAFNTNGMGQNRTYPRTRCRHAASWFCWAFPLLVTEVILQGRKILKAPSPVSSFETGG